MNAMTRQRQKLSASASRGRRPPDHRGVGRHRSCRRRRLPRWWPRTPSLRLPLSVTNRRQPRHRAAGAG